MSSTGWLAQAIASPAQALGLPQVCLRKLVVAKVFVEAVATETLRGDTILRLPDLVLPIVVGGHHRNTHRHGIVTWDHWTGEQHVNNIHVRSERGSPWSG